MNPVHRGAFLVMYDHLKAEESLRRVREAAAGNPYMKQDQREAIVKEWQEQVGYEEPKLTPNQRAYLLQNAGFSTTFV